MANLLSRGAIKEIADGNDYTKPVFQLLALKKLSASASSSGATDRYRLLMSDGLHSNSAMLAVQLNQMVDNKTMELFSVIQLDRFVCNPLPDNRRVMIVLEVSILQPGSQVGGKIGNPTSLAAANQKAGPQAPNNGNAAMGQNLGRPSSTGSGGSGYGGSFANAMVGGGAGAASPPKKAQPINSLTPYQNRWTIKVRVSNKSGIRTWSNSRGEGKLFSMDLVDQSGEIRCTAFREQCDKFYDMLEVGKVYFISKGTLKPANRQYSSIQNDYEMVINQDTNITPTEEEDDSSIPNISFDFKSIEELENIPKDTMIDIIGICKSIHEVTTITTKATKKEVSKREIQLVDDTNKVVNLTLWGKEAEEFQGTDNPVIAIKGARVSDFGGRSLSVLMSSILQVNPDIPKAHQLKGWYDNEGCNQEAQSISDQRGSGGGGQTNWLSLADVRNQNLGQGDKADYFTTKGTIIFMRKENCMYMACPSADCNKKVVENGDGSYRCEKCSKDYPEFQYRLLLSTNIADSTETQWVTCFQETAEAILGQKADYVGGLRDSDESAFNTLFQEASFKPYIFKMRVKMETYNDEARLKCTCMSATPLDYKEYSKKLIMDIRNLAQA